LRARTAGSREPVEEVEEQPVDLLGAFLVDPVAAVRTTWVPVWAGQPSGLAFDRVAQPEPGAVTLPGLDRGGDEGVAIGRTSGPSPAITALMCPPGTSILMRSSLALVGFRQRDEDFHVEKLRPAPLTS